MGSWVKEKGLYSKYTIPEIFSELKKLRTVKMTNGKEYLTEMSKNRELSLKNLKSQFQQEHSY